MLVHAQDLKTLVVEDTQETLEYLTQHLQQLDNINIIGAVSTCKQARALLENPVDLLIVDLGLPDGNGIDLIKLAKKNTDTKVIVITVFGDEKNVVGAIEAGADGYLLKDADSAEIAKSLVNALNGIAPISPAIAGHLLRRIRQEVIEAGLFNPPETPSFSLTEKETIILETLAKGFSYKEIARIQNISYHTVNEHLKAIYRKLSVNSRGEAVYEAVQAGIIDP